MKNAMLDFRLLYVLHFTIFENSEINNRLKYIGRGGRVKSWKYIRLGGGGTSKAYKSVQGERGSKIAEYWAYVLLNCPFEKSGDSLDRQSQCAFSIEGRLCLSLTHLLGSKLPIPFPDCFCWWYYNWWLSSEAWQNDGNFELFAIGGQFRYELPRRLRGRGGGGRR